MQTRPLGALGDVSVLALGGGGIGGVWGSTTREEAVATVRAAVDAGIRWLDLAPIYGRGEAERVVGEAFGGSLPGAVRVATKCHLGNPPPDQVESIVEKGLQRSLESLGLDRVDVLLLHNYLVPDGYVLPGDPALSDRLCTPWSLWTDEVRPCFERLVSRGRIGAWGITGTGLPATILEALHSEPLPAVVQCVANLLDSPGGMRRYTEDPMPRELIRRARRSGVGVLGIRAVAAGALCDEIDRDLAPSDPTRLDWERAAPFRELARELEVPAARLAHRYALSIEGVDSVILGVKNRAELADALQAEIEGPLDAAWVTRIDRLLQ